MHQKDIAELIAMGMFFIVLPTIIFGFTLAYKNLKIKEKRVEAELRREEKELELTERTLNLREKEADIEAQKLALEIRALDSKQLE